MKKLAALAITGVAILSLVGCSSAKEQQLEAQLAADINALPSNVIEDTSDDYVYTPVENEPVVEQPTQPTQTVPVQSQAWATVNQLSDRIEITYANGVPDSFVLSNGYTFGEVADYFEYAVDRFNKENFRKVFSLYYGDEANYNAMSKQMGENMDIYMILIASVSWETYNHFGIVESQTNFIDVQNGYKNFYKTDGSKVGTGKPVYFVWDDTNFPGETYIGYDCSLDNLIDYGCTVFTDDTLNFYATVLAMMYEEKGGNQQTPAVEQPQQQQQQPQAGTYDSGTSKLTGYYYLSGYEAAAEKAVCDYYNSTIARVDKKDYDTSEGAEITMANGKKCTYYGSSNTVYIYDSSDTYDTIWQK